MIHIAILKKSWKLLPKIVSGEKTVESRWYKTKRSPWNKVTVGDAIYFKDSGSPVNLKAIVIKVEQFEVSSEEEILTILNPKNLKKLGYTTLSENTKTYIHNKRYGIFVHFNNVKPVTPFNIDKIGFGMQSAWITSRRIPKL